MRTRELLNKIHAQSFQPFRVRLSNKTELEALDPNTVVVGPSSAIMPIETLKDGSGYYVVSRWRTVALSHMVEFVDIEPRKASSRRRKAS